MNVVPVDVWTHVSGFLSGNDIVCVLSQTSWTLRQIFADIIETSIYQVRVDITWVYIGYLLEVYILRDSQPVGKRWTFDESESGHTPWNTLAQKMLSQRRKQSSTLCRPLGLVDVDGVGLDPTEVLGSKHYGRNYIRTVNVFNPFLRRATKTEETSCWTYWAIVVEYCELSTAYDVAATSKTIRNNVRHVFYQMFSVTLRCMGGQK
eukprot:PhF_6_TR14758/c0_g1_i1/m.23164